MSNLLKISLKSKALHFHCIVGETQYSYYKFIAVTERGARSASWQKQMPQILVESMNDNPDSPDY